MHTISFSEASLSLFLDDEKHVQYIQRNILAPYNVISYDVCDVLVVYRIRQGGLFNLWSCTNMNPIY